ncbi:MAG: DNA polymerase IV [Actinomycetota bacterium]
MNDPSPGTIRSILHVDMDAFYASVELLRRPELRGQPVIVGGAGRRGVVAAASYEARWFGVRSAMPSSRARRLCPHAVFLSGDHAHYREISGEIMAIMARYTPLIEPLSLDEAFLDVTAADRLFGDGPSIARQLRTAIHDEIGLWCSAGVATNKFLAKLASEQAKPSASKAGPVPGAGVFVIEPGQERSFLDPLPARALWGVGAATMAKLERIGIASVGDIAAIDVETLTAAVGKASGRHLAALSRAIDDRPVEPHQRAKSMSQEETYAYDRVDRDELDRELIRMSDSVAGRLRKAGLHGRTVTIKVRFGDFRTITRSETLGTPTDTATVISRTAKRLLDGVEVAEGVRLLGVGATGLDDPAPEQLSLDDLADAGASDETERSETSEHDWRLAEEAVDEIRRRFGTTAIGPATLIERGDQGEGLATRTENENPWG